MNIGNINTVTQHYISTKGNDFVIVSIALEGTPANLEGFYNSTMYGTIPHDYIASTGRITKRLSLGQMGVAKTVAEAIDRREFFEATEGMTEEQLIAFVKAGNLKQ